LQGDLKKAARSGIILNKEPTENHAREIYDMYAETVKRNHGIVRYNKKYFNELVRLNHTSDNMWCYVALLDETVIGFIVFLFHHDSGYYLHGGIKLEYKKYCPSSFLLYEGIKMAQQKGMRSFNLMTSPANQKSLVIYKEKWGAETRDNTSISIKINPAMGSMFNSVEKIYQFIRTRT
jgi:lipid II:glycine glycyltransferase (peptidoglycan interpeptide bridge formation enzyme)